MKHKILFLFFLLSVLSNAQVAHCDGIFLELEDEGNKDFIFDSFTPYIGGTPSVTIARLKVRVTKEPFIPATNLCSWNLSMYIDNNDVNGTDTSREATLGSNTIPLEQLISYGNQNGINALIDIIEIRAVNECSSSEEPELRNFVSLGRDGGINLFEIIPKLASPYTSADIETECGNTKPVNAPGSYFTNFGAYNFRIEIRIKPGLNYNPGFYNLKFHFRLEQNLTP